MPGPYTSAPVVETARLRLRPHTVDDFADFCALWANPDVVRYTTAKPSSPEEAWARLLRGAGHWSLLGFGSWILEERTSGCLVGEAGLLNLHRGIDPAYAGILEAGWVLLPAFHGRGYATEALTAIVDWAAANLPSTELACIIHPENAASLRLAYKFGFTQQLATMYHDHPTLILTRPPAPAAHA